MTVCEATEIAVLDQAKKIQAKLNLALLPKSKSYKQTIPPLIRIENSLETDSIPPIQLLESCEYHYEFISLEGDLGNITTSHPEVFETDTKDGHSGRVRPGLYTGTLPVKVYLEGSELGSFSVEVRSRKLGYLDEYRWMVRDLAEQMSEVVMNRFAPAVQQFSLDNTRDAHTLYQRFAFLKSLISGEDFQAAISEIVRRPHVAWIDYHEPIHPSKGIKAGSYVSRQMAKAGPRSPWKHKVIDSIPLKIHRHRTEVTVDTTPNRFVKFALEQWRDVVARIAEILANQSVNPAIDRGLREVEETRDYLDSVLAEGLFRELGNIDGFPADNQVLHKREGYRDVFQAYIQFDVAAKLSWAGGEDVYGAGKRDVATLYEYWVFMKLAQLISELCDTPFDFTELIEVERDCLNVTLKKGRRRVLKGILERQGRKLALEFWFNRTFSSNTNIDGSWSHQMRPDYSLKISPADDEAAGFESVFVHFDAKYRINHLYELFGSNEDEEATDDVAGEDNVSTTIAGPKRDDLLKMHAYRDAIRRSAGAYVLYPGTEKKEFRQYHELLPGLGAFALRPTETGEAAGKLPLARFLEDMLEHIASQITQHERGRYWIKEIYSAEKYNIKNAPLAPFLNYPPADTQVLLGYVKSDAHWEWIEINKRYNLRSDDRRGAVGLGSNELASDLILLSCPKKNKTALARVVASPELHSKEQMEASGYPQPKGIYYCFCIEFVEDNKWGDYFDTNTVEKIREEKTNIIGAPVSLTWSSLLNNVEILNQP